MKKTILLVTALILIFSLCRTGDSYAVSNKKLAKLARKAEKAITEAQTSITQWGTAGYIAPSKAKEILEKAQRAYEAGNYEDAREVAEESFVVSSNKEAWKLAKRAKEAITEAQASITKLETDGYAAPKAKAILGKARRTYEVGNYGSACELAKESLAASSDKELKKQARKVVEEIKKAEKEIAKWESEVQIPIPAAKKSLEKARLIYQTGDYEEAYKTAYRAYGFIKQALWAEKYIRGAEGYVTKWEYAGYDAPQAKKLIADAREAQKLGDNLKARQLASMAIGSLKQETREISEPKVEFYLAPGHDLRQYRRIAILELNDAPQAPGSGKTVTRLISDALTRSEYQVVSDKAEADAVVSGILIQYKTREEYYELHSKFEYLIKRKETYSVATVELVFNMKDVRTGSTIWQGSGKQEVCSEEIEPVAQKVINAILDKIPQRKY